MRRSFNSPLTPIFEIRCVRCDEPIREIRQCGQSNGELIYIFRHHCDENEKEEEEGDECDA